MNTKGFIKIELSFFDTTEFIILDNEEGATGVGCLLKILKYLRRCNGAVGSLAALPAIARDCRKVKKYVEHIIRDFGLFHLTDDGHFYSDYLSGTLHTKEQKQDEKTCNKTEQKTNKVTTKLQHSCNNVATSVLQTADNQRQSLYIEDRKIEDSKIEDRKETSSKERTPKTDAEDIQVLITQMFNDEAYMAGLHQVSELDIHINREIRFYALVWLRNRYVTQNKHPAGITDAKQYLTNLLRKGRKTRDEFLKFLNDVRRKRYEQATNR